MSSITDLPKKLRKPPNRRLFGGIGPRSSSLANLAQLQQNMAIQPGPTTLSKAPSVDEATRSSRARAPLITPTRSRSQNPRQFRTPSPRKGRSLSRGRFSPHARQLSSVTNLQRETRHKLMPAEENFDQDDPDQRIVEFRSNLWRHIERQRRTLNLDVFWPQNFADDSQTGSDVSEANDEILPLEDLRAIIEFRNLKSLYLTGMLISYQKYIWLACWLNPDLENLTLEMALGPELEADYQVLWTKMGASWKNLPDDQGSTEYLGDNGTGTLRPEFGFGEYLDVQAIRTAHHKAKSLGVDLLYLPVVNLVVAGFVVDAHPFKGCFNPSRLRRIRFKRDCFDAGFALPAAMSELVNVKGDNYGGGSQPAKEIRLTRSGYISSTTNQKTKKEDIDRANAGGPARNVSGALIPRRSASSRSPFSRSTGRSSRDSPARASQHSGDSRRGTQSGNNNRTVRALI